MEVLYSNMDSSLVQERNSIELKDDSSNSSLAASASESEQELFLGVEAYSFERKKLKMKSSQSRKFHKSNILILKDDENYYHQNQPCQIHLSSLQSVSDLISAREYDACTLLSNLGFGYSDINEERKEILKRFHAGFDKGNRRRSKASKKDNLEQIQNTSSYVLKGINKTNEWLSSRCEEDTEFEIKTKHDNTSRKNTLHRVTKLRSKFSKSRQSSFDIMPGLREDSNEEKFEMKEVEADEETCGKINAVKPKSKFESFEMDEILSDDLPSNLFLSSEFRPEPPKTLLSDDEDLEKTSSGFNEDDVQSRSQEVEYPPPDGVLPSFCCSHFKKTSNINNNNNRSTESLPDYVVLQTNKPVIRSTHQCFARLKDEKTSFDDHISSIIVTSQKSKYKMRKRDANFVATSSSLETINQQRLNLIQIVK